MSAIGIHDLPFEIHKRIYRFLDPASHLDFALTNKHIYYHSHDILEHHRECHKSIQIPSDWSPGKLMDAIRNVAIDHIAAWHIRTFKGIHASLDSASSQMDEANLSAIVDLVSTTMIANDIPVFGISRMRRGDQASLQAALIALCPKLRTLVSTDFSPAPNDEKDDVEEAEDLWDDSQMCQQYTERPAHNFFGNFIRAVHKMVPKPIWPPGLNSLCTVMIGKPLSGHNVVNAINIAPIFLLPSIRNIYLGGLYLDDDYITGEDWGCEALQLPEKSSSVEHLFLEAASPENVKHAVNGFVQSAKALRSFVVKDCEFHDFDVTVNFLHEFHGKTLETLIYSDEEGDLRGYRCSKFAPENQFEAIRSFMMDMSDVRLGSLTGGSSPNGEEDGMTGNVGSRARFIEYFKHCAQRNAEILIYRYSDHLLVKNDIEAIGDAFVELMEEECCSNLRTLYIDEVVASVGRIDGRYSTYDSRRSNYDATVAKECRARVIRCGKEHGIEVVADAGSTQRYIDEVCNSLFDFKLI